MKNRSERITRLLSLLLCIVMLAGCASPTKQTADNEKDKGKTEQTVATEETEEIEQTVATEETEEIEQSNALSFDIIGGKDVMPIGGFTMSGHCYSTNGNSLPRSFITDEYYQLFADAGINFLGYYDLDYAKNPERVKYALELAEKYNIAMFVNDSNIRDYAGKDNVTAADIGAALAEYCDYPAFAGAYLIDEPDVPYFAWGANGGTKPLTDWTKLGQMFNHELDVFGFANLYGNFVEEYMEPYERYVNEFIETYHPRMISFDTYIHDEYTSQFKDIYFWSMDLFRNKSKEHNIPFWFHPQVGTYWNDKKERFDVTSYYPNEAQTRWTVTTGLAFGAKGIKYYPLVQLAPYAYAKSTEWDFKRNGLIGAYGNINQWYYYVKDINKHVAAVDEVLMNAVHEGVILSGKDAQKDGRLVSCAIKSGKFNELQSIDGSAMTGCFTYNGKTALYVVNYDMEYAQYIELSFDGAQKMQIIQNTETFYVEGEKIVLDMAAGEGVLLVIE